MCIHIAYQLYTVLENHVISHVHGLNSTCLLQLMLPLLLLLLLEVCDMQASSRWLWVRGYCFAIAIAAALHDHGGVSSSNGLRTTQLRVLSNPMGEPEPSYMM